jgi:signal transduction histidine kinase
LQRHVSPEQTGWTVRGQDGNVILQSDKMPSGSTTVKTSFVGNFPPWFVDFYQQEPRLFDALLSSRRSIYFGMFLLIVSILIFGSTLTIRAVGHEMELARLKSDFVSTISHEFKSPVTSIRQLAEMLKTNRVPSEDRRERYYDVLVEQSERLALLIDNILDFSKMEEGRKAFVFEKTNIGELLQELVSTNQDRVRHQGFAIQAKISDDLPSIRTDRAAMSQAINNLIDNAIKYSGKAKKVFVYASTDNQHLIIAVQDFGIGIKKEEITKVFERFYRGGDELTRMVKGSGLGLTLVKQIVEAHHGSVHGESELGHGSTFEIRLPLQAAENESRSEK